MHPLLMYLSYTQHQDLIYGYLKCKLTLSFLCETVGVSPSTKRRYLSCSRPLNAQPEGHTAKSCNANRSELN